MNQQPIHQVLVISFELANPGYNVAVLVARIKQLGDWARVSGSTYLSYTQYDPQQVRDWLAGTLQGGDKIYVTLAGHRAAWRGFPDVISDWIRARQG